MTRKSASKQQLRDSIRQSAGRGYPFYVYTLADASGVFYIGKGKGNRVFVHEYEASSHPKNAQKCARISRSGGEIEHQIVAFFRDEHAAYGLESTLIAESSASLTNIAKGQADPRERAIADAKAMLAAAVPFEQTRLARDPGLISFPFLHFKTARELYAALIAAIRQEADDPTPMYITVDSAGRASFGW